MANTVTEKPKRGRPKGQGNYDVDTVRAEPTRCRRCGSTNRTRYTNTRVRFISGTDFQGRPYSRMIWRRTQCLHCGQYRDDIARVYEPDGAVRACNW